MSLGYTVYRAMRSLKLHRRGIHKHMKVFSHTTPEERMALNDLARALPEHAQVLEIGSHIGSSALFLGAALKSKGGRLFCVDTWQNETMPDGEADTSASFDTNTRDYADIITKIRKRSDAVVFEEIGTKLDMVFIDGDHSEDGVRADFALIEGWVKPAGVVAFHDASPVFPGVNKVIGEALASGRWLLTGVHGTLASLVKVA